MIDTNVVAYIEVNVICMIISAIMYVIVNPSRSASNTFVRRMVVALWILCVADIGAVLVKGQTFDGAIILIESFNLLYYLMASILPFIWLGFTIDKLGLKFNLWQQTLIHFPLIISCVLVATNPVTNFLFSISEDNLYVRGTGIIVHWVLSWFYIILAGALAINAMIRTKSPAKKQEYAPLLYLLILPLVGSVAQMCFYGITSYQVGVVLMMVLMTLKSQADKITRDELTGINNRNALNDYIEYIVRKQPLDDHMVMMIDINEFKHVNDTLGHEVGDIALAEAATLIKEAVAKYKSKLFLCRYGGDEFVIVGKVDDESSVLEILNSINAAAERFNRIRGGHYKINFSTGYFIGKCSSVEKFYTLLQAADAAMYEDKKKSKK